MKTKIYIFYLITTEYSIQKLIAMANYTYNMHMYRDPVNHNRVVVMYAWTTSKDLKKTFLHERGKMFICKKIKLTDSKLNEFKKDNAYTQLIEYKFKHYCGKQLIYMPVIAPKLEVDFIIDSDYIMMTLIDILQDSMQTDYYILKDKFMYALDSLGYTSIYDIYLIGNEARQDTSEYNFGYGLGTLGNRSIIAGDPNELIEDQFTFYYDMFGGLYQ